MTSAPGPASCPEGTRPPRTSRSPGIPLAAALVALAEWAPSVAVLGALAPLQPRRLPVAGCSWRGPPARRAVALTFDDGPSPEETDRTLGLLAELDLRASFFLLGERVEAWPELCRRVTAGGHCVGSHGHRHVHHLLRSPAWIARDLARSATALAGAGALPRFFRPPYGQPTAASLLAARRLGMETVLWSAWGREFADADEDRVLRRLTRRLRPGAVVLLHDCDGSAPPGTAARTHRLLPPLAAALSARRLEAVTLDELLTPARR